MIWSDIYDQPEALFLMGNATFLFYVLFSKPWVFRSWVVVRNSVM
jgi:hypothetical protein